MKIALMLESDGPGGAETVLLHTARGLAARGHAVLAVGPEDGEGWLRSRLDEQGIPRRTFRLDRPVDRACVRRLERLLQSEGVDLVHSHEFTMAVYGAAATRRRPIPHVVTMHGGRYYAERLRRRLALRWALGRSPAPVAVSVSVRDDLSRTLGLPPDDIAVVPNGLPTPDGDRGRGRAAVGARDGEVLVVAVGNLYPVKGHRTLVRAAGRLPASPPWRIAIAGRGSEEAALKAAIAEEGVSDRVRLLGLRRDVPDLLAAADVFVMPSLNEGHPLALIEAMLARKAIVASRVGGIPELVRSGDEGLLVEPRDPDALAAGLTALIRDRALRDRLAGSAGRAVEARFGLDRMLDDYETIYGAAISSSPGARAPVPA